MASLQCLLGRYAAKPAAKATKESSSTPDTTSRGWQRRCPHQRRRHRFSWINEWRETLDDRGRAVGIELILPDWFYAGVLDRGLILTIDRAAPADKREALKILRERLS